MGTYGHVSCCAKPNQSEKKIEIEAEKKENKQALVKSAPKRQEELESHYTHNDTNEVHVPDTVLASPSHTGLTPRQMEDMTASIIKVQKVVRGSQTRESFQNKIKPSLFQSQMEIINTQKKVFSSLKAAENNATNQAYSQDGWMEFYSTTPNFTTYDYGNVHEQKVMVVPPLNKSTTQEVSYYTGSVNNNNERHGYGILSNSQVKYEGFWRNNEFSGWGRETTVNGNILEGVFVDGKLNGKGRLINSKGESFLGNFIDGKKEGDGKETTNQYTYEGNYANNAMNGKGAITFAEEKNEYKGDFVNNELTGEGKYEWESGERYEGPVVKGNYHGYGTFYWPDGQVYEGEYVNGIKEGKGKMTYPNGNIYEGPYVNGNPHGIGKYTKKGKIVDVQFENGDFIKIIK